MIRRSLIWAPRALWAAIGPRGDGRTGRMAIEGGSPVRNTRLRPWPSVADRNLVDWGLEVGRLLRRIYVRGVEGLPQPMAIEFGRRWAEYCSVRHGLLMAHGTDALRIGLAAALDHDGLDYGGEIIVPNFSFIASATAPLDRRFGLVFVDIDPVTLLIDPAQVEAAVTPGRTRAILPVHLFGQPADMTALRAIADRHGLKIIEDAAQAHGAAWDHRPVGGWGEVGAFSFQSSKNLACGEGGALVTNDSEIFERAYSMHDVGRARVNGARWDHRMLGWNCRPTEYQAALLLHRLRRFDRLQARRRRNFDRLRELLAEVACVEPVGVHPRVSAHGMYMFAMRYRPEQCGGLPVDTFLATVRAEGIPLQRAFHATLSDQPAIRDLANRHPDYFRFLSTPAADQAARDTVYLPHHVFLGAARDMEDIVAGVRKVERHFR